MIRWFMNLPAHRKVLLLLSGGMLTLVFDAFVDHFKWTRAAEQGLLAGMNWNQWIPIFYGLISAVLLAAPALRQLEPRLETRLLLGVGIVGLVVGHAGMFFHLLRIWDALPDERTISEIGKTLKDEPPIFAPAAFAGVGLLLVFLKRLTGANRSAL
jgi:hypothetical protein